MIRPRALSLVTALLVVSCSDKSPTVDSTPPGPDSRRLDGPLQGDLPRPPDLTLTPDKSTRPARWETVPGLAPALAYHTATALQDGKVLIVGGELHDATTVGTTIAEAYLYDPAQNSFAPAGKLAEARHTHTATLLADGRVIVIGGGTSHWGSSALASVEIFDPGKPVASAWSAGTSMPSTRMNHTTTRLQSGKLLIAGGVNKDSKGELDALLFYDATANSWSAPLYKLSTRRSGHSATLLKNGKILIAGGSDGVVYLSSLEVVDTGVGTVTPLSKGLDVGRLGQTADLLGDGRVLIVGGYCGLTCPPPNDALYDPASDKLSSMSHYGDAPKFHASATLLDGRVLIAGGMLDPNKGTAVKTAVLFATGGGDAWVGQPDLSVARMRHTATTLKDGSVLVVGGLTSLGSLYVDKAERFYP